MTSKALNNTTQNFLHGTKILLAHINEVAKTGPILWEELLKSRRIYTYIFPGKGIIKVEALYVAIGEHKVKIHQSNKEYPV